MILRLPWILRVTLCLTLICVVLSTLLTAEAWTRINAGGTIPTTRYGHTAVLWDPAKMIVFGGRTVGVNHLDITINETSLCFDIGTCGELEGLGICLGCNTSTGCYCQCTEGYSSVGCADQSVEVWLNDVSIYDVNANTWTTYNDDGTGDDTTPLWPYIRYAHSAVMINGIMIIYGGYSQLCQDYCSDVWEYNTNILKPNGQGQWTQTTPTTDNPGKRWRHTVTAYGGSMYLFGGHRFNEYFNDIWRYDLTTPRTWTLLTSTSSVFPSVRLGMTSAIDSELQRWYIYGGWDNNFTATDADTFVDPNGRYFLTDTWMYDFNTTEWTLITQPSDAIEFPPPAFVANSAVVSRIFFLFGGYADNQYSAQIWRYNASSLYWTQHRISDTMTDLPLPRSDSSVVYFPDSQIFLMFAGWGSASEGGVTIDETIYQDLWKFDLNNCPNSCNARGQCFFGYCYCVPGYFGEDCQNAYCKSTNCSYELASQLQVCAHCNGHGECLAGDCLCSEGFKTPDNYESLYLSDNSSLIDNKACTIGYCPQNCNKHGTCALNKAGGYSCACSPGWSGRDCSQAYCTSTCNFPYGSCDYDTAACECAITPLGKYTGPECLRFVASSGIHIKPSLILVAILMTISLVWS